VALNKSAFSRYFNEHFLINKAEKIKKTLKHKKRSKNKKRKSVPT